MGNIETTDYRRFSVEELKNVLTDMVMFTKSRETRKEVISEIVDAAIERAIFTLQTKQSNRKRTRNALENF